MLCPLTPGLITCCQHAVLCPLTPGLITCCQHTVLCPLAPGLITCCQHCSTLPSHISSSLSLNLSSWVWMSCQMCRTHLLQEVLCAFGQQFENMWRAFEQQLPFESAGNCTGDKCVLHPRETNNFGSQTLWHKSWRRAHFCKLLPAWCMWWINTFHTHCVEWQNLVPSLWMWVLSDSRIIGPLFFLKPNWWWCASHSLMSAPVCSLEICYSLFSIWCLQENCGIWLCYFLERLAFVYLLLKYQPLHKWSLWSTLTTDGLVWHVWLWCKL